MKIAGLCCLALAASTQAFAPAQTSRLSVAPRMSDAVAEAPEEATEGEPEEVVEEALPPAPAVGKYGPPGGPYGPVFPNGNRLFLGKNVWDTFTQDWGSEETGKFLMAAELKHGRAAMLGFLGFLVHEFGFTLDKISPHEYLSVTQGVKFADLSAMNPVDAFNAMPKEGYAQMFAAIAAIEIYELTHADGEIKKGESVAPGLRPGGLTGDLGWNPLKIPVTDRLKSVEIQNGRTAMWSIACLVFHYAIPGSVPIWLPWEN